MEREREIGRWVGRTREIEDGKSCYRLCRGWLEESRTESRLTGSRVHAQILAEGPFSPNWLSESISLSASARPCPLARESTTERSPTVRNIDIARGTLPSPPTTPDTVGWRCVRDGRNRGRTATRRNYQSPRLATELCTRYQRNNTHFCKPFHRSFITSAM